MGPATAATWFAAVWVIVQPLVWQLYTFGAGVRSAVGDLRGVAAQVRAVAASVDAGCATPPPCECECPERHCPACSPPPPPPPPPPASPATPAAEFSGSQSVGFPGWCSGAVAGASFALLWVGLFALVLWLRRCFRRSPARLGAGSFDAWAEADQRAAAPPAVRRAKHLSDRAVDATTL